MDEFIEIQFLGSKKMKFTVKATQYPEKLRILDMLSMPETYKVMNESDKSLFEEN